VNNSILRSGRPASVSAIEMVALKRVGDRNRPGSAGQLPSLLLVRLDGMSIDPVTGRSPGRRRRGRGLRPTRSWWRSRTTIPGRSMSVARRTNSFTVVVLEGIAPCSPYRRSGRGRRSVLAAGDGAGRRSAGESLVFSLVSAPAGMGIDPATGHFLAAPRPRVPRRMSSPSVTDDNPSAAGPN
jgi:hypothetical protein